MKTKNPPPFVDRFYRNLIRKPDPHDKVKGLNAEIPELDEYFPKETSKSRSRTTPENRCSDVYEMMHLGLLAGRQWEVLWKNSFNVCSAASMLFSLVLLSSLEDAITSVKLYVLTSSHLPRQFNVVATESILHGISVL